MEEKLTGKLNPLGTVVQPLYHLVLYSEETCCERLCQSFLYTDVIDWKNFESENGKTSEILETKRG